MERKSFCLPTRDGLICAIERLLVLALVLGFQIVRADTPRCSLAFGRLWNIRVSSFLEFEIVCLAEIRPIQFRHCAYFPPMANTSGPNTVFAVLAPSATLELWNLVRRCAVLCRHCAAVCLCSAQFLSASVRGQRSRTGPGRWGQRDETTRQAGPGRRAA